MSGEWQYQLRVYLDGAPAEAALADADEATLRPLRAVLRKHDATMVSQFRAFEAYVAEAEREGVEAYPLYRWTKATVEDPAMRAKHIGAFALRIGGQEVYDRTKADALEADIRPLVDGDVITRMSRHDTNPASNIPVPDEYRT